MATLDPQQQRALAVELFNRTWELIAKPDRSQRETDLMIHSAHASRLHWEEIGSPANHARGEWQVSHVYAVLGRGEPAMFHARRCLEICEQNGIADWDLAYAHEAVARAARLDGDEAMSVRHLWLAQEAGGQINEPDDGEAFLADLTDLLG